MQIIKKQTHPVQKPAVIIISSGICKSYFVFGKFFSSVGDTMQILKNMNFRGVKLPKTKKNLGSLGTSMHMLVLTVLLILVTYFLMWSPQSQLCCINIFKDHIASEWADPTYFVFVCASSSCVHLEVWGGASWSSSWFHLLSTKLLTYISECSCMSVCCHVLHHCLPSRSELVCSDGVKDDWDPVPALSVDSVLHTDWIWWV